MDSLADVAFLRRELQNYKHRCELLQNEVDVKDDQLRVLKCSTTDAYKYARVFDFTQQEANFFTLLMSRREMTTEGFLVFMYAASVKETPVTNIVRVIAHKIRKILKPYDVTIHNIHGVGYHITSEDKQKVYKLLRSSGYEQ